ncbi:hypothetical protein LSH36_271g07010 [Paralvinella palmiformis]|uniref:Uncharacterized protein n=1 Tax=Paralvinella palmiformis TaxID=53620 RepID=A0AAD9JKE0_9ANNE|nr:hypothetical protein LSH36_271g07010 [Paralvinella palmiformis]
MAAISRCSSIRSMAIVIRLILAGTLHVHCIIATRQADVTHTAVRLGKPYGTCVNADSTANNVYTDMYPVIYSHQSCIKSCYRDRIAESCQCMSPYYPFGNGTSTLPICNTSNRTQGQRIFILQFVFVHNRRRTS